MGNTKKRSEIMTIDELAEYLQLHPLTLRNLARAGKIPMFKVGRQWRAQRSRLDQWIKEQSHPSASSD